MEASADTAGDLLPPPTERPELFSGGEGRHCIIKEKIRTFFTSYPLVKQPSVIHCDNMKYVLSCSVHIYTWNNHSAFVYLTLSYCRSKEQIQLNRFNYYNDL